MPTEADDRQWNLSVQQQSAADLLAVGSTVTNVAEQLGVSRQTVSAWLNQHPAFQAALNHRRQELWDGMTDRLRSLQPKALDVLENALATGNLKAAVEILKATGMYGLQKPDGPTDPRDAKTAAAEKERVRQDRELMASLLKR
jgi:transposase-like protein